MSLRMRVHDREPIGAALRRFKKLVERSGKKRELRAHEHYEKPCDARRRKEASRLRAIKKGEALKRAAASGQKPAKGGRPGR
jgi:small subunit ribosomal protein S21